MLKAGDHSRAWGWLEQRRLPVLTVNGGLEADVESPKRGRIDRDDRDFRVLTVSPEMRDASVPMKRSDGKAHDLVTLEPVADQRLTRSARLRVARRLPPAGASRSRPFYGSESAAVRHSGPFPVRRGGIPKGGVGVARVEEERGNGQEHPAPGGETEAAGLA